ncbi:hypothetical protein, partial [uncultured Pseudodesulfovibrio sp.]|uniref:hypothetical protein n=1 Tax=uncultured Pseudodesulfovibrio sp. TaxID=2035858 RepID=UPI0029C80803
IFSPLPSGRLTSRKTTSYECCLASFKPSSRLCAASHHMGQPGNQAFHGLADLEIIIYYQYLSHGYSSLFR